MPSSLASARAKAAKLERAGDLQGALAAYEAALSSAPNDPDLLASVAALAERLEMPQVAANLWAQVSALEPGRLEAVDGRARALRDLGRFDEAIEVLRATLLAQPEEPRLWNALGVTLTARGEAGAALTFFDEAIRLDARSAPAFYNRGGACLDLGEVEAAQADFDQAARLARKPADAAMIAFATATLALVRGDLAAGWDAYEARFSRDFAAAVTFEAPGQRWRPADRLEGRHLLVVAEQGLGDEIMFANVVPDVIEALGPNGRLSLAVEPRLVDLFARSFPGATVMAHATDTTGPRRRRTVPGADRSVQLWTPMASLLRRFRRSLDDFPPSAGYLRPDPARAAHWRDWLGAGPPTVGITWRSGKILGERRRFFASLEDWATVLKVPGVRFVNLQYGDCAEELAVLGDLSGAEILEPPGLNIREEIDDLAALCSTLDVIVAAANATGALAAACGAPIALLGSPADWPRLGTGAYPWYPQARGLTSPTLGVWTPALAEAAALVAEVRARRG